METIALPGGAWKLYLTSCVMFAGTYAFYRYLCSRAYALPIVTSGLVGLSAFIPLWAAWRVPSKLALKPGVVQLRYWGPRLRRSFKASEVGVALKHMPGYSGPDKWMVYLAVPGGDEIYLTEMSAHDEAAAFAARIQAVGSR